MIALCETRDWWHCMKSPMAIGPEASNYLKPHDLSNGRIVQSIVSTPPHPPPSPPLSSPNLSLLISAAARTAVSVCYYYYTTMNDLETNMAAGH